MAESGILGLCSLIGKLKHLKRTGWLRHGISNVESVASHMYRMSVLAFMFEDSKDLDRNKCIRMALVHDMAEAIVGDITPFCGVSGEDKHQLEKDAMKVITDLAPPSVSAEFTALWEEYEKGESPEALVVKDLDKFDMISQAFEYEQSEEKPKSLQEFFDSTNSNGYFRTDVVKRWAEELETKRAQHK